MNRPLAAVLAVSLTLGFITPSFVSPVLAERIHRGNVSYSYTREVRAANQLLQTGKYVEAEAMYTAALKKNPNNLSARGGLAAAQAELFKLDAAEKNANQVLAKSSKNPLAHMALGMVYRNRTASHDMFYKSQRDDYLAKSAAELEKAVAQDPQFTEAHNELGVTYRMQGRYNEAQNAFNRALALDSNYGEALVNNGIMKFENGDIAGAKSLYQQAIKRNSKNYMAHYRLGEALIEQGDYHAGLSSLNTGLALNRNNATIMSKMADAYARQGNTAASVANYRKAIQANPGYMPAYVGIANMFDNRGDGEAAMVELRSALNVNPNFSPARNQLGRLALTVDKPEQALEYYREALRLHPEDPDAIQGLSQALTVIAQKGATTSQVMGADSDLVNAEEAIQEALRLNPNDMRLHLASLRISQLAGKPGQSQDELNRIVNSQANSETEEMIKGEAYLSLGRYAEADQVFNSLILRNTNDPKQLLVIGDTLKSNGDLDRAEDAYQAVLAVEPTSLKAQRGLQRIETARQVASKDLRLAKSLNNFWQKNASVDFYEDTLSKNPRQPDARLALAKLYEKQRDYAKAANSYQFYLGLRPDLEPKQRQRYEKKIAKLQELAAQQQSQSPNRSQLSNKQ